MQSLKNHQICYYTIEHTPRKDEILSGSLPLSQYLLRTITAISRIMMHYFFSGGCGALRLPAIHSLSVSRSIGGKSSFLTSDHACACFMQK